MAEKYDLYSHKNIVIRIFREHWARFKEFHPEYITEDIEENVEKMLGCGVLENGFFEYMCLSCLNIQKSKDLPVRADFAFAAPKSILTGGWIE